MSSDRITLLVENGWPDGPLFWLSMIFLCFAGLFFQLLFSTCRLFNALINTIISVLSAAGCETRSL